MEPGSTIFFISSIANYLSYIWIIMGIKEILLQTGGDKMKTNKKLIKNIIIVAVIIAIGFFGYKTFTKPAEVNYTNLTKTSYQETVLASGRIEAKQMRTITSEVAASITSLLVSEGDVINQGDIVAKLDSSDLGKNINEAKAGVNTASANYNKIVTTSYEIAKADIEKLELELSQQNRELERTTALYESGAIPLIDLESVTDKINVINKQLESAKLTLTSLSPSGSEAKKAQASISQSRVTLKNLEQSYGKYSYSSSISGTVVELNVTQGEYVQPGKTMMKIVDLSDKYAQIEVDEKSITKIAVGQKAFIYPSSDTRLRLETTVREIATSVNGEKGTVAVKLDIPDSDSEKFLLDLSITAELVLNEYQNVYVIDANYLYYEQEIPYILTEKDGIVQKIEVKVLGSGSKRIIEGELTDETRILNPLELKLGDKVKLIAEGE